MLGDGTDGAAKSIGFKVGASPSGLLLSYLFADVVSGS